MSSIVVRRIILYGACLLLAVASFAIALTLPTSGLVAAVIASPGAVALLGALYQLLRDHAAHELQLVRDEAAHQRQLLRDELADHRNILARAAERSHDLAVTSHMANVAFDKHVEFVERYLERVQETIRALYRQGPAQGALDLCGELVDIRLKYAAWLTKDVESKLTPVENALHRIGVNALVLTDMPVGEKRSRIVEEMFNTYRDVLGLEGSDRPANPDVVVHRIIDHLRSLLHVEQFSRLRTAAIDTYLSGGLLLVGGLLCGAMALDPRSRALRRFWTVAAVGGVGVSLPCPAPAPAMDHVDHGAGRARVRAHGGLRPGKGLAARRRELQDHLRGADRGGTAGGADRGRRRGHSLTFSAATARAATR